MSERFKLIAENLNTGPLLKKILANEELWGRVTDRQNYPGSAHKETETIYLRWAVDESLAGGWYCLESKDRWDEIRALAPEIFDVIKDAVVAIVGDVPQWDVNLGRVILTRMKSYANIAEHVDEGPYADRYERFHVCLSGESEFWVDGQMQVMKPSQLWWFNHKVAHRVRNGGFERIHLIIDLLAPEYRKLRGLTFQRERAHELLDEARPLFEAHYKEVAHYQDIPLDINEPAYMKFEEVGLLRCYTARYNGELVGYCVYKVSPNLRYQSSVQAIQDILYVDKSRRGALIGKRLIEYTHAQLKAEGCQVVYQHAKIKSTVGQFLELLGYELIDGVYGKRLDQ